MPAGDRRQQRLVRAASLAFEGESLLALKDQAQVRNEVEVGEGHVADCRSPLVERADLDVG